MDNLCYNSFVMNTACSNDSTWGNSPLQFIFLSFNSAAGIRLATPQPAV